MRRAPTVFFVVASVLAIVPSWTGEARLALLRATPTMIATPVALDPRDPARKKVGALTYLGGVALESHDPAFGGFSALGVRGDRFTLLGDGGTIVRFAMGDDWRPHALAFANLPGGPGLGWDKRDRDSESMAIDPGSGRIWVGFENFNAIWRYAPGFARAEAHAAPRAIRGWPVNGGAESLARLPNGRFVAIGETARPPRDAWRAAPATRSRTRDALIFAGDPVVDRRAPIRFAYRPWRGFDPADATALPNGDLLVLERAFAPPYRFSNRIARIPAGAIRGGDTVGGGTLAVFAAPSIHDNFEGIATTREGDSTVLWIVSDDNQSLFQRTLLLKFRLDG